MEKTKNAAQTKSRSKGTSAELFSMYLLESTNDKENCTLNLLNRDSFFHAKLFPESHFSKIMKQTEIQFLCLKNI